MAGGNVSFFKNKEQKREFNLKWYSDQTIQDAIDIIVGTVPKDPLARMDIVTYLRTYLKGRKDGGEGF